MKTVKDVVRDTDTGIKSLEPTPATLVGLQFLQLGNGSAHKVATPVQIKQQRQSFFLLRFVFGFQYPRRFFE